MVIEIKGINKSFGKTNILQNVNLFVKSGELVSILGPSGIGKTTLLKILANIEKPDAGKLHFDPPPGKLSPVILVFQDFSLFPFQTVFENIAFGLRARNVPKREIESKVAEMLIFFELQEKATSFPMQLSSGQKQRVALARALVVRPSLLLLDEPFANLDKNRKSETALFIRNVQRKFGITTIAVTHDFEEAFLMSDKIGIMLNGTLEQFDCPENIYFNPASSDIARFLGPVNLIEQETQKLLWQFDNPRQEPLLVRAELLELLPSENGNGEIVDIHFTGTLIILHVKLGNQNLTAFSLHNEFRRGMKVRVLLKEKFIPEKEKNLCEK